MQTPGSSVISHNSSSFITADHHDSTSTNAMTKPPPLPPGVRFGRVGRGGQGPRLRRRLRRRHSPGRRSSSSSTHLRGSSGARGRRHGAPRSAPHCHRRIGGLRAAPRPELWRAYCAAYGAGQRRRCAVGAVRSEDRLGGPRRAPHRVDWTGRGRGAESASGSAWIERGRVVNHRGCTGSGSNGECERGRSRGGGGRGADGAGCSGARGGAGSEPDTEQSAGGRVVRAAWDDGGAGGSDGGDGAAGDYVTRVWRCGSRGADGR